MALPARAPRVTEPASPGGPVHPKGRVHRTGLVRYRGLVPHRRQQVFEDAAHLALLLRGVERESIGGNATLLCLFCLLDLLLQNAEKTTGAPSGLALPLPPAPAPCPQR